MRLQGLGTTIFTEMSALAARTGAINLGQGFPDSDGPAAAIEAAVDALRGGENQYAPLAGVPALRDAVREHQRDRYGLEPEDVLVTFGATEAIAAALLALCDPGEEVVVLEPYYDSYAACIAFAGARRHPVTLFPPDFTLDGDALRAAITPHTKVLLLNSPHNPTGRVLSRAELELIAAVCVEHDLICVSDEVYEHLVFEGEHLPPATLPGMAERTLTIRSSRACRSDAHGQAVPDVRGWHAAAARGRRGAALACGVPEPPTRRAARPPRPALHGAGSRRRPPLHTARYLLRQCRRRRGRSRFLPATAGALRCGRESDFRVLRRSDGGRHARAVRILQARIGDLRSRATAGHP
jgi:hypothetical protein